MREETLHCLIDRHRLNLSAFVSLGESVWDYVLQKEMRRKNGLLIQLSRDTDSSGWKFDVLGVFIFNLILVDLPNFVLNNQQNLKVQVKIDILNSFFTDQIKWVYFYRQGIHFSDFIF